MIKKILSIIESHVSRTHINILKTVYVNFRLLSFKDALKFPIYIYGKCNICSLAGKAKISGDITMGMLKFGLRQGYFTAPTFGGMLFITENALIEFDGPCSFDYNYVIRITGTGVVHIGKGIGFGSDMKFFCENKIRIGDFCRIPFGTTFMDTNYHYSINTTTGVIYRKNGEINIGNYNWIGNTSTIMKGTKTSDGCIIASKSHLNKDFVKLGDGKNCLVIGGSPATILKENNTRIHSYELEAELNKWFEENSETKKIESTEILGRLLKSQPYMQK